MSASLDHMGGTPMPRPLSAPRGTGVSPVVCPDMGETPMLRSTGVSPVNPPPSPEDDQARAALDHMGGTPMPLPLKTRGTGVPPVNPPPSPEPADRVVKTRQGAYLPHWTQTGATYAVTFRLGDSLPRPVLEAWLQERRDIVQTAERANRPITGHEEKRLQELHSEQVEAYLDAGHGKCWLQRPEIAQLVSDALRHFDGRRYRLHAWCVMPNHVHVVVEPMPEHELPQLLHSWKSFVAKAANRLLARTGAFWQEEYYDHLVRDQEDYTHALRYLMENPVKARLPNWPWVWPREDAPLVITAFQQ